jgi:hypothetical protein
MAIDMAMGTFLLMLLFPAALGDNIAWEAMLKPQGGEVRYDGDGAASLIPCTSCQLAHACVGSVVILQGMSH